MTLTLHLSLEAERKLQELAASEGQSLEGYAQNFLETQLVGPNGQAKGKTWREICAPITEAMAESGMTDDELKVLLTEAQKEVRAERRKRRQGSNVE